MGGARRNETRIELDRLFVLLERIPRVRNRDLRIRNRIKATRSARESRVDYYSVERRGRGRGAGGGGPEEGREGKLKGKRKRITTTKKGKQKEERK